MKWGLLLLLTMGSTVIVNAQANYDASLISKDLLPYASAVIRNKETTVEVKTAGKVITHKKFAITILNKNGDYFGRVSVWHNKTNTVNNIKGTIYNAAGIQIGKFGKSDFTDVYAAADFNLFEDSRILTYEPAVSDYPYTVVYECDTQSDQSLDLPNWMPNEGLGVAVEKNTFALFCKPDFKVRYNQINLPTTVVLGTTKDGLSSYTWTASNLKAVRSEPYSPPEEAYLSNLQLAPENFSYGGLSGSFIDWNSLGKWTYDKLLSNRGTLTDQTISYIKNLTKDIADPKLKAKKIYEYMQQKTRYVSIQVGIGGYQPMLALDVDRLNYGDCKALVNYMQALLKAADIESWYCVVQAGSPKVSMQKNFASMEQGNHIILCLPFKNDTTWLECTNQQMPFGFLGDFTDDRLVLACTPQGGKLLHTLKYDEEINHELRKANFSINEDGQLSGDMETVFKGVQYENRESMLLKSQTDRNKDLKNYYPINNLEVESLSYKQDKAIQPAITESIKLTATNYVANSNNNLYFNINAVNRMSNAPRMVRTRFAPLYINEGYVDDDEITYKIPANYRLNKIPLNVHLSKPFGTYDATITTEDGKIIYKRKVKMIDGTYSKDLYQDFVDFNQAIIDADNYSAVLVKKTN